MLEYDANEDPGTPARSRAGRAPEARSSALADRPPCPRGLDGHHRAPAAAQRGAGAAVRPPQDCSASARCDRGWRAHRSGRSSAAARGGSDPACHAGPPARRADRHAGQIPRRVPGLGDGAVRLFRGAARARIRARRGRLDPDASRQRLRARACATDRRRQIARRPAGRRDDGPPVARRTGRRRRAPGRRQGRRDHGRRPGARRLHRLFRDGLLHSRRPARAAAVRASGGRRPHERDRDRRAKNRDARDGCGRGTDPGARHRRARGATEVEEKKHFCSPSPESGSAARSCCSWSPVKSPRNHAYQPQNEFKLDTWVNLGIFSINKAVLYLFLAGIATCVTMIYIARRMQRTPEQGADGGRGAVPPDARQHHGQCDGLEAGRQVVPVHRHAVPVHLLLEPDRLHPAADEHRARDHRVRPGNPLVLAVRGDGEPLDPARAGDRRVRLLHVEGVRKKGPIGYLEG